MSALAGQGVTWDAIARVEAIEAHDAREGRLSLPAATSRGLALVALELTNAPGDLRSLCSTLAEAITRLLGGGCLVRFAGADGKLITASACRGAPDDAEVLLTWDAATEQRCGEIVRSGRAQRWSNEHGHAAAFALPPLQGASGVLLARRAERRALHLDEEREALAAIASYAGRILGAAREREYLVREREEALAQWRAAERELEGVLDTLPVMIARIGVDERLRFASLGWVERLGHEPDQIEGAQVAELIGAARYERHRHHIQGAIGGVPQCYETTTSGARDGDPRALQILHLPRADADGRPDGYLAVARDVTEQRRSEARMAFLAEATRVLTTETPLARRLDAVGRLAVPGMADRCTIDAEPLLARTGFSERHLAEGAAQLSVPILIRDKEVGAIQVGFSDARRHFSTADRLVFEDLARRTALAIEHDELDRRSHQALEEREEFLQIASHELRTPLTSLELEISALLRHAGDGLPAGSDCSKLTSRLGRIYGQVRRLTRLIDELLDFSLLASGLMDLAPEPLDLALLVAEATTLFHDQAQRANSQLQLRCPGALQGNFDRKRIEHILINLISNAIKYGAGHPIDIELERTDRGARLSVRDQGPGIAACDQRRIFERFTRASPARHYGGVGLGLWIVQESVHALGGQISVESRPGFGATFVVDLPVI